VALPEKIGGERDKKGSQGKIWGELLEKGDNLVKEEPRGKEKIE